MSLIGNGSISIKRCGIVVSVVLTTLAGWFGHSSADSANGSSGSGPVMTVPQKTVTDMDRYKNFSTAQSCIKVVLRDTKTGQVFNAVFGNEHFARILAGQHGHKFDKRTGRIEDQAAYEKFLEEYVEYMSTHGREPLDVTLDFDELRQHQPSPLFDKALTFQALGVTDEAELLNTFFDFNPVKKHGVLKSEFYEQYARNASFIALLIELGYDVVWGDYIPTLNIYAQPFPYE